MKSNTQKNQKASVSGSGAVNPSTRIGLMRSLVSEELGVGCCVRSSSVGAPVHTPACQPMEIMDGAWLLRAVNQNRKGLPAIEVAEQQLGKIIDFASTKSNISKDLKTALLRLSKSMDDANKEHVRLVKTATAELVKVKVTKST